MRYRSAPGSLCHIKKSRRYIIGKLFESRNRDNAQKTSSGESVMTATLGVSTFILNLIMVLYGSETKPFPNPINLGKFYVGNVTMKWNQVIIAIAGILVAMY